MDLAGPVDPVGIQILNPTSGQTVILPGEISVRVEVAGTAGLLESVDVTAFRFPTFAPVGHTAVAFDPPEGDTILMLALALDAFPTNTQLNIRARAEAQGRSATSADVPVIVIDCSSGGFEFCP